MTQQIDWALSNFGNPGQETSEAKSRIWLPTLQNTSVKKSSNGQHTMLKLVVKDENTAIVGGWARNIKVELFFPDNKKDVRVTLQWFNKSANRLPEAFWFSFIPAVKKGR